MTDAPTADPSVAVTAPVATLATPAPAAVAATAEFVNIPVSQMQDTGYGTNFHALMADAKYGREARDGGLFELAQLLQENEVTPQEHLALLRDQIARAAAEPPQPQGTPAPAPQPGLTKEQAREEFKSVLREDREQTSHKDAWQAEADHRATVLDTAGLKVGEDGKLAGRRSAAEALYDRAVHEATLATVPSYASEDVRRKATASPASPEILADADRRFTETWADLGHEAVAAAAIKQDSVPDATLGDGPGGADPPPNFEDLTEQEKEDLVMKGIGEA